MTPGGGPRLAVVVTTYQHSHFLGDALRSVVADRHLLADVVVVDDGSTDRPDLVVAGFDGVRLIRQDNRGLSSARNTGLEAVDSDYVLFLDADDVLVPGGLAATAAVLATADGAALVYGGHVRTDQRPGVWGPALHTPLSPGQDAYLQLLRSNIIGMNASAAFRRQDLLALGGFDTGLQACEDYDAYLRLAARGTVRDHTAVVAAYRQHDANMSGDEGLMLLNVLRVLAKQRTATRREAPRRRALRAGVQTWLRYYGPGLSTLTLRRRLALSRTFPLLVPTLLLRGQLGRLRRRGRLPAYQGRT